MPCTDEMKLPIVEAACAAGAMRPQRSTAWQALPVTNKGAAYVAHNVVMVGEQWMLLRLRPLALDRCVRQRPPVGGAEVNLDRRACAGEAANAAEDIVLQTRQYISEVQHSRPSSAVHRRRFLLLRIPQSSGGEGGTERDAGSEAEHTMLGCRAAQHQIYGRPAQVGLTCIAELTMS